MQNFKDMIEHQVNIGYIIFVDIQSTKVISSSSLMFLFRFVQLEL